MGSNTYLYLNDYSVMYLYFIVVFGVFNQLYNRTLFSKNFMKLYM